MSTGPRGDGAVAGVQTLDRGLRLLHLLAAEPSGLTVGELADRLGVHRTIVYRLVGTLARHRLVVRGADGRHRLWTGLVELARSVVPNWRAVAVPELEALAADLGATATLSVAAEDSAVALLVMEPRHTSIHVAYRPGQRHPLTRGASGKAILAGRPPRPGEPAEVTAARRRGYAVTRGEIQAGAVGIAAPVVVDGWAEASVGAVSFTDFDRASTRRVLEAAERIAEAFASAAEVAAAATTG
jgi:DNA-binding IclR family transcriptional regulator